MPFKIAAVFMGIHVMSDRKRTMPQTVLSLCASYFYIRIWRTKYLIITRHSWEEALLLEGKCKFI